MAALASTTNWIQAVSWPRGGAVELSYVRMVGASRERLDIVGHLRSRQRADGLLERSGPFGMVDARRSGSMQESPRQQHVVERVEVTLQLVVSHAVRLPGIRGGPDGAPGGGTGPGVPQRPGPGQDRRTAQTRPAEMAVSRAD
jgi:hypothetical protein